MFSMNPYIEEVLDLPSGPGTPLQEEIKKYLARDITKYHWDDEWTLYCRKEPREYDEVYYTLVNPNDVMPSYNPVEQEENDCGTDDIGVEHESISVKHEIKTPIKQEVQPIESNILTPPRTPENSECSKTEMFPENYSEQSGRISPLLPDGTDIARCLAEFIEGTDLIYDELPCKDEPLEQGQEIEEEEEEDEEEDDDDNDVDEEKEIIAEERMQQMYRYEVSNSSKEWIKWRGKSIRRPINPTENDHSYYKGLRSEETLYGYYTPSESEDSEVDVISLPTLQEQIQEQQYLMQLQQQALPLQQQALPLQQQALPPQEEKPQRRQPQRRQRKQQDSTPTTQVEPVRQVRQRGRKPAAKGKSSMPNKVSPAPKEVSALDSLSNFPEETSFTTEGKVTRAGTKRKAANKSPGPATKRRRGRASGREMMPAEKREQHNNMERMRRVGIRNLFDNVRITIPEIAHIERASKVLVLSTAVKYVKELQALDEKYEEIKAAESHRGKQLRGKLLKLNRESRMKKLWQL